MPATRERDETFTVLDGGFEVSWNDGGAGSVEG